MIHAKQRWLKGGGTGLLCLFVRSRTAPCIYLRCSSPARSGIQFSTSQMKQLMAVVSEAMSSSPTRPFHLCVQLSNSGRTRAHHSGAPALPNRAYNVVAGRQLTMWAPNQGVSRIPCLRFESSPGLSCSLPGLALFLISQPSECAQANTQRRSRPLAAGGSLRVLAA